MDFRTAFRTAKVKMSCSVAAGGYVKWHPPDAIFLLKCGRWYFENAVGRENRAKPRPVDSIWGLHRPRCRMTVPTRLFPDICITGGLSPDAVRHDGFYRRTICASEIIFPPKYLPRPFPSALSCGLRHRPRRGRGRADALSCRPGGCPRRWRGRSIRLRFRRHRHL